MSFGSKGRANVKDGDADHIVAELDGKVSMMQPSMPVWTDSGFAGMCLI